MALPGVVVVQENAPIGIVQTVPDGVTGLIVTGVAISGWALNVAKVFFSLQDAVDAGLTPEYDTTNAVLAYRHVAEFYNRAPRGTELWVMLVANTVTLTQQASNASYGAALRDASGGRIQMLGLTRVPASGYTATTTNGIDQDVLDAITAAQTLAEASVEAKRPLTVMVEGRGLVNTSNLPDQRAGSNYHVAVIIGNNQVGATHASVGLALGHAASLTVNRSLGRVASGPLGITAAALSNGADASKLSQGLMTTLHDKGYIFIRQHEGNIGFYFQGDPTCTTLSNVVNSFSDSRLINKATRVAQAAYLPFVNDDQEVTEDGSLEPGFLKHLETVLSEAVVAAMPNETSSVTVTIEPQQDVEATSQLEAVLQVQKRGKLGTIIVKVGL